MQTNGIGTNIPRPTAARAAYGLETGPGRGPVSGAVPLPTYPTRTQPAAIERPAAPAAPAGTDDAGALRPPKGTDPELWKVLTADERAFFAREDAMGPLSYGQRISSAPTLPARGGRINLRG